MQKEHLLYHHILHAALCCAALLATSRYDDDTGAASEAAGAGADAGDGELGVVLLFAAGICHAGIAVRPTGIPALKGLPLRVWSDTAGALPLPLPLPCPLVLVLPLVLVELALLLTGFADVGLEGAALSKGILVEGAPLVTAAGAWLVPGMRYVFWLWGVVAAVVGILWLMSFLRLLSSVLSSISLESVKSF